MILLKENLESKSFNKQFLLPTFSPLQTFILRVAACICVCVYLRACLNKLLLKALEYKWPFPHWVILSACRVGWDGGGSSRDEKASWPPHKGLPVRGAMGLIIRHQTPRNSSVVFFFFAQSEEFCPVVLVCECVWQHYCGSHSCRSTWRRSNQKLGQLTKEKIINLPNLKT